MLMIVTTLDGVVVRQFCASGERAWRYHPQTETWAYSADHKGPWVGIGVDVVPKDILANVRQALVRA